MINKNINQKDHLAFLITDGSRTTSFLKEGHYFFISAGNTISISPRNSVKSISVERGVVDFRFFSKDAAPCEINLLDDVDGMISEYIENFLMVVEEQRQKAGQHFIGFALPKIELPLITRINIDPFLHKTLKNRIINFSPNGQKSYELTIPENMKLSKLKSKYYTKIGGIGETHFFGTRIPIEDFEVSDSGTLFFKDVVKSSTKKLPPFQ